MAAKFPPSREAELVPWGLTWKTKITASPLIYSLTAAQATANGLLYDDFLAKWNVCQNPTTKSKSAVELKDTSKGLLVANIRMLAKIVQNAPTTTNAMRIDLGLPQRNLEPTPIPIPSAPPEMKVVSVFGRNIRISLRDATHERRGRPLGTAGAQVFSFVGMNPPTDIQQWKAEGAITRGTSIIVFGESVPAGAKVWFTACWFNPRGLTGPACTPIPSGIGYEGAEPLAA